MTWQKLLKGSQTEVLSRIISVLPFHELPYGQMKVEDWSQAHVPSVLWLLYRGLPDGSEYLRIEAPTQAGVSTR